MTQQELDELLEAARHYRMSPEEREEQRISFAYGNVVIENPSITKDLVRAAASALKDEP